MTAGIEIKDKCVCSELQELTESSMLQDPLEAVGDAIFEASSTGRLRNRCKLCCFVWTRSLAVWTRDMQSHLTCSSSCSDQRGDSKNISAFG